MVSEQNRELDQIRSEFLEIWDAKNWSASETERVAFIESLEATQDADELFNAKYALGHTLSEEEVLRRDAINTVRSSLHYAASLSDSDLFDCNDQTDGLSYMAQAALLELESPITIEEIADKYGFSKDNPLVTPMDPKDSVKCSSQGVILDSQTNSFVRPTDNFKI